MELEDKGHVGKKMGSCTGFGNVFYSHPTPGAAVKTRLPVS